MKTKQEESKKLTRTQVRKMLFALFEDTATRTLLSLFILSGGSRSTGAMSNLGLWREVPPDHHYPHTDSQCCCLCPVLFSLASQKAPPPSICHLLRPPHELYLEVRNRKFGVIRQVGLGGHCVHPL